jgi:outer membrane protein OmpA-like peptidoglycan-associated protein
MTTSNITINYLIPVAAVAALWFGALLPGSIATAQSAQDTAPSTQVASQSVRVQGIINSRNGSTMTVHTDSGNATVVLSDDTRVEEIQGVLHARRKQMALAALVPGLAVQVQGSYDAQNQVVADVVRFNGSSLKTAADIQAGITPVEQQTQAQQQQLAQQQAALQQQQQQLQAEQQEQAAQAEKIAANQAALADVNKRFGELADYNIWDEVTIYFGNGQVKIAPQDQQKLQALAEKASTVTGYTIQVQGYASKVGSAAFNQKLSQERAENVIDYLEQECHIPLTNMLAPGAMGTSQQVAPDNTSEGNADNRRVTVRVLQNKGIAGV